MHVHTCMHVHKYMHMHACTACVEQLRSVPYTPNWFTHSATYVYCKMHIYMRTCTYAHVHIRMAPAQLPTVIWRACVPPPPTDLGGGHISVLSYIGHCRDITWLRNSSPMPPAAHSGVGSAGTFGAHTFAKLLVAT